MEEPTQPEIDSSLSKRAHFKIPTVLMLLLGGGLALLTMGMEWGKDEIRIFPDAPAITVDIAAPKSVLALGAAVLAGALALLVFNWRIRQLVGMLLIVIGIGLVILGINPAGEQIERTYYLAALLVVLAGLLVIGGGILSLFSGAYWRAFSKKYELEDATETTASRRISRAKDTQATEADSASAAWKEIEQSVAEDQ